MNRMEWWLLGALARLLEPHERGTVLGDIAESGESAAQALAGVTGLVIRRQAALWCGWQPWLTLLGLVVPLAMLLNINSHQTADGSAIPLWMYVNNWETSDLHNAGFRLLLAQNAAVILLRYLKLAAWSWTGGLVLGSLSRRTSRINGALFLLALASGVVLFGVPPRLGVNQPVFSVGFYRDWFPAIVQFGLVIAPALWGVRRGIRISSNRPLPRIILATWMAVIFTMAVISVKNWIWWRLPNPDLQPTLWESQLLRFEDLLVYLPMVYLAARAVASLFHGPRAALSRPVN